MSDQSKLTFSEYSINSLVVKGDKESYHEIMKGIGGRWDSRLKNGPGWIVPKRNQNKLENYINILNKPDDTPDIVPKPRKEQKKYHREESDSDQSDDEDDLKTLFDQPPENTPEKQTRKRSESVSVRSSSSESESDSSRSSSSSESESDSDSSRSSSRSGSDSESSRSRSGSESESEKGPSSIELKERELKERELLKTQKEIRKKAKKEKILAEIKRLEEIKAMKAKKRNEKISPDPIQYYKSFTKTTKDFRKLYHDSSSEDDVINSSSSSSGSSSGSSSDFPSPGIPQNKKYRKTATPKKKDLQNLLEKFNDASRRLHELEIRNRKLESRKHKR